MYRDNVNVNYTVSEIRSFENVLNKSIDNLNSARNDAYSIRDEAVSCLDGYIGQCERYLESNKEEYNAAYSLLNSAQCSLMDARDALKEASEVLSDLRSQRASAPQESQSQFDGPISSAESNYSACERRVNQIDSSISRLYKIIDGINSESSRLSTCISKYNGLKGDVESALSSVVFAIDNAVKTLEDDLKRTEKAVERARDINDAIGAITKRTVDDDSRIVFSSITAVFDCAEGLKDTSNGISSEIRNVDRSKDYYASQVSDSIMAEVETKLDEFCEIQREIAVQWQKISDKLSDLADALERYYNI